MATNGALKFDFRILGLVFAVVGFVFVTVNIGVGVAFATVGAVLIASGVVAARKAASVPPPNANP
jgi:hypothetical protein